MRLQRLDIQGFGRLRGSIELDVGQGKLALLVARNEAGKSTLAQAILASLYGLSPGRRSRAALPARDVHRPWNHQSYGSRLLLTTPECDFLVERDFDTGSVRVLSGSEDVTQRFQRGNRVHVGDILTGLTRQQFELSFFMGQGGLVWSDPSQLSDALQRAADSQTGSTTAARAIAVLDKGLGEYDGITLRQKGSVLTEIQRCEVQLAADRAALQVLEAERAELTALLTRIEAEELAQRRRETRRRVLRCRHARTRAFELTQRLEADRELGREIADLQQRVAAEPELLGLDTARLDHLEAQRRRVTAQRGLTEHARQEAAETARVHATAAAERAAFGLHRTPTEEDVRLLLLAVDRLGQTEVARRELTVEADAERADLAGRGLSTQEGLALAVALEDLDDLDRQRLATYRHTQASQAERRTELGEQIAAVKKERARIRHAQQVSKHFGVWCLLVGVLPVLLAISMHDTLPFSPGFLYGPGFSLVGLGILVFVGGARWRGREDAVRKAELKQLRARDAALTEADQVARQQWDRVAAQLEMDPLELGDAYERYRMAEPQLERLRWVEARIQEQDTAAAQTMSQVAELWTLLGEMPDPRELAHQLARVQAALSAARRADEAAAQSADAARRAEQQDREVKGLERTLREELAEAGVVVAATETIETGFARLRERSTRATRLRAMRDQRIPELVARQLPPERAEDLRRQRAEWEEQVHRLRREVEGALTETEVAQLDQPLSQRDVDAALASLAEEDARARVEDVDRRTAARAFLTRYESDVPKLRESIEHHAVALRRAREFRASVELARTTLAEIARDTHRDWASALNERGRSILREMQTEVTDLHFDENLGLRVEHTDRLLTAIEAAQQLSAGALDAVYLASRLAVADYLHPALPLVLDDPFANVDDARLLAALRHLVSVVAPRRQVLLLACQASRYRWALAQLDHPAGIVELEVPAARRESAGP